MIKGKTVTLQISKVLAAFVSVSVILAMGQVVYWSAQPSTVLTIKNDPLPAQPPEVHDGDQIHLTIDFCKSLGVVGISTVNLIGETARAKIAVTWPIDTTPKQCALYPDVPVPVPAQTPTDRYHVEFVTCYTINPLKHSCTTFNSQSFKVVNSKLNPGDARVTK